ncbi:MAG: hypothetical protein OEV06_10800 [Anaerolineae bacterium]|nr:hypothetical protein [Anaerolineae bacterium]
MENEKKLNLMKFWLFGTFVIIFSAVSIYVGGVLGTGLAIFSTWQFWLTVVIAVVLSVLWFYIYKAYLNR